MVTSRNLCISLCLLAVATAASAAMAPLDISSGFNQDAICGALEFQAVKNYAPAKDLQDLQGGLDEGLGRSVFSWNDHMVSGSPADSTLAYSLDGWGSHPRNYTNAQALPEDGIITSGDTVYHMASHLGNATLPGDWTEAADLSAGPDGSLPNMATKSNVMYVYSTSSTSQILSQAATLPVAQQGKYTEINFVLGGSGAMNYGARNIQIVAVYSDASEDILYSFANTASRVGPVIDDSQSDVFNAADFNVVEQFTTVYNSAAGTSGNPSTNAGSLFEFSSALALDANKMLVGIRIQDDSTAGLSDTDRRGLSIMAASAAPVPEPATLSLLVLGGLAILRRRNR